MPLLRKILLTLMVIGGLTSTIGAGTYASFNASTTNESSTFATGSLVLGHKVAAGTVCLSVGAGTSTDTNDQSGCTTIINQTRVKLGDQHDVNLTLNNAGTVPGTLTMFAVDRDGGPGVEVCTPDGNTGVSWTGGTGDMCAAAMFVIQEYTDSSFTTKTSDCAWPAGVSQCVLNEDDTLEFLPPPSSPYGFGAIPGLGTRYFKLSFKLSADVDDQLQGRRAQFQLTWTLTS